MEKPENETQYRSEIERITGYSIPRLRNQYNRNKKSMKEEFETSVFYNTLRDELTGIDNDYDNEKKVKLIDWGKTLVIDEKTFDKMLNKCYRYDIINNKKWECEEDWQKDYIWHTPLNCYIKFPDIIRTRITIRYLDGVNVVFNKLMELADNMGLIKHHDFMGDIEGYYCVHFELVYPLTILTLDFLEEIHEVRIEIQLTTQIKDVVNEVLHEYYEAARMTVKDPDKKWQWDHKSTEFLPNYLGHVSHYVEGMLLEARKRIRSEKG